MYLLDTTAIIELFRGNIRVKEILNKFPDENGITSISYFELFTRIYHKHLKKEERYFSQLFLSVPIYFFDLKAAEETSRLMASLYENGTTINQADVTIAGICVANKAKGIITMDKDFERIRDVSSLEIIFI